MSSREGERARWAGMIARRDSQSLFLSFLQSLFKQHPQDRDNGDDVIIKVECRQIEKGSGNGIADHTDLKHHGEVAMPSEVRIRLAAFDDGAACEVGRQSKQQEQHQSDITMFA